MKNDLKIYRKFLTSNDFVSTISSSLNSSLKTKRGSCISFKKKAAQKYKWVDVPLKNVTQNRLLDKTINQDQVIFSIIIIKTVNYIPLLLSFHCLKSIFLQLFQLCLGNFKFQLLLVLGQIFPPNPKPDPKNIKMKSTIPYIISLKKDSWTVCRIYQLSWVSVRNLDW